MIYMIFKRGTSDLVIEYAYRTKKQAQEIRDRLGFSSKKVTIRPVQIVEVGVIQ